MKKFKILGLSGLAVILILSLILGGVQIGSQQVKTPEVARALIGDSLTLPVLKIGFADAATVADYTIDGTADNVQFQQALDALPATGGIIQVVSTGTITFAATVSRAINNVVIQGAGTGTYFGYNATNAIFSAGAQSGWTFRDFRTDAGGLTYTTSSNYILENITVGSTYYPFLTSGTINAATGRGATLTVAANDATAKEKAQADYLADGTADDVQINAALNALPAGGGKVMLSSGTFNLAAAVVPNKANYILSGQGYSTLITQPNATNLNYMFGFYNQANQIVENIRFDGNGANQTSGNIIWLGQNAIYPTVRNCWILDSYGYGIFNDSTVVQFNIHDNYFKDNEDHNIAVDKVTSADTEFRITNNTIYNNKAAAMGITVSHAKNGVISNNIVKGVYNAGVLESGESINVGSCENIVISNNFTSTTGDGCIIVYSYYDEISRNITITGNIAEKAKLHGINAIDYYGIVRDIVITGNISRNNGQQGGGVGSGIYIWGTGIVVTGNRSYDDQEIPTQPYSLLEDVRSGFNTIVGNDFSSRYNNLLTNSSFETSDPPADWTLGGVGASRARSNTKYLMGSYSVALTRAGADASLSQTYAGYANYKGRVLHLKAYVWSSVANRAYIQVNDGVNFINSGFHPGDSHWHQIDVEIAVSSLASTLVVSLNIATGDTVAYFDNLELSDLVSNVALISSSKDLVRNNMGYMTSNSGSATVVTGTTSTVVNHGLASTPTRVFTTFRAWGNAVKSWITAIGASNFTVNVDANPAANITLDWRAVVGEEN